MQKRKSKKIKLIILLSIAIGILLISLFAKYICPYDPYEMDLSAASAPPSIRHIMGTDRFGRDLFSRVLEGSANSVWGTIFLVGTITIAGTFIGVISGYNGGIIDTLLMRITDVFLAFPILVFALAASAVLGSGMINSILALCLIGWPKYARLSRNLTATKKEETYITAAKLSGCNAMQLLVRHIVPAISGSILVTAVSDIGTMMMELAALTFLGMGVKTPIAEWGRMINDGRNMLQITPHMVLAPGFAIFFTVVIFNILGESLREYIYEK